MKKTILTFCLSAIFSMAMAQEVKTYSVYDTNQSGGLTVSDATEVVEQVKKNVTATSTQQYVTADDLKTLFTTILTKLESVESRLSAIEAKMGIEAEEGMKEKIFTANGVTFKMMPVEEGTFTMGATEEQINSGLTIYDDEKPTHQVTLSGYYIGETEVTQALWYAVMGAKPSSSFSWSSSYGLGDNYPAYNISWEECQIFIANLNSLTGAMFRMPTEAEWEYAARGGNKSQGFIFSGSNTIDDVAWYTTNTNNNGSKPVATKAPNELGIYDMSGNVCEWCSDSYGSYSSSAQTKLTGDTSGALHVNRGSNWFNNATYCRVACRSYISPSYHSNGLGLRLALSPQ